MSTSSGYFSIVFRPEILDGKKMTVGNDAELAWGRIIESELARPLHVETARSVLVVGVDLFEFPLQIGDAVEIGIDALHGRGLLLAD